MIGSSYSALRALLFRLDPERAHHIGSRGLSIGTAVGLLQRAFPPPAPLETEAFGLTFPNPVGLAAGFDKDALHVQALLALGFGFVEVGTVTPRPQAGNPQPRLFRIPERDALINRLGFNNRGLAALVRQLGGRPRRGVVGVNIGRNRDTPNEHAVEDYLAGLRSAYGLGDYIAVNVSSPNTAGLRELQRADPLRALLDRLLEEREALTAEYAVQRPLLLKVAPDLDAREFKGLVKVFNERRPDGVIATNTTVRRDGVEGLPHAGEAGGLSGAPLKPLADDVLERLRDALDPAIGLVGVGGIMSGRDAVDKRDAGAALVQFYTGFIYRGPALIRECVEALRAAGA